MKQEGLTYEEFAEQWANFDFNKTMNDIVRKRREPLDIPTMATDFFKEHGLPCPYGYEFRDENGNVINTQKIVLEKKKPKYPKNYNECCDLIGARRMWSIPLNKKEADEHPQEASILRLLDNMRTLLICRDAYWYWYATETNMPFNWKPDWAMYSAPKHCIIYSDNEIKWQGKHFVTEAKVLAFPTEEMRDAFYENFKDLIEECKELL